MLVRYADKVRALTGWRRYGVALMMGAMAALAFPPFNVWPLLWVGFVSLVFLLQGAPDKKRAFAVGWTYAFGHLVVCLYWIAGALFVDIRQFWWLIPFSVGGLPAMFALYHGLAALLAWRIGLNRLSGVVALGVLWAVADYARGHLMTGFPWDLLGYVWGDALSVLQITSVVGIYGLTLITALMAVLPAAMVAPARGKASVLAVGLAFASFIGIAAWGQARLVQAPARYQPGVRLRLVQPNTDQAHKWLVENRESNFNRLMDLSFAVADQPLTAIIWPETATPFFLTEDVAHRHAIADRLLENQTLLTGVVQRGVGPQGEPLAFNSLISIDNLGTVTSGYAKHHLVPFGEYVPFRKWLPFRAVASVGDFTPGEGAMTLRVPELPPFSPLVCYEAIFPGDVVKEDDRPAWMLNVTNDAWYEGTTGPAQHFAIVRVRAIEEGIPLVRVANMGVNAIIDGYGRSVVASRSRGEGSIDGPLPSALDRRTPFAKWKDAFFESMTLLFLIVLVFLYVKNSRNGNNIADNWPIN